jgi:hypothetical protein
MVQVNFKLTQEYLKSILHYDPDTGVFTWLITSGAAVKGSKAGSFRGRKVDARLYIGIRGRYYPDNRLAYLYMTGSIPKFVDHINRIRDDNRWVNLRPATASQNMCNSRIHSNNTSGIKGVHWNKVNKRWIATLGFEGKKIHIGSFEDLGEAERAVTEKRKELHGDFACNG